MTIQERIDKYYNSKVDAIYASLPVDEAIERTYQLLQKAKERIYRETGYRVN